MIIFCSSEEPLATTAWVQFRVITSFKLLHGKGFYSAIVPEVTQKLALILNNLAVPFPVLLKERDGNGDGDGDSDGDGDGDGDIFCSLLET